MLTQIYIEALLDDEALADQIQEALIVGEIDEVMAYLAWWFVAVGPLVHLGTAPMQAEIGLAGEASVAKFRYSL